MIQQNHPESSTSASNTSTDIAEVSICLILEPAANKMKVQLFIAAFPLSGFQETTMENYAPVLL